MRDWIIPPIVVPLAIALGVLAISLVRMLG